MFIWNYHNMLLKDIVSKISVTEHRGPLTKEISEVVSDSRRASPGSLFVAVKGLNTDGHQYIDQAISLGVSAVVCSEIPNNPSEEVTYIVTKNTAKALGSIAANFFGNPSKKLQLIGITGTNGKTTVVSMLYDVFTELGHRCGMISTTGNRIAAKELPAEYTTPDAISLNKLLKDMAEANCTHAFMEVSSHALAQYRTEAIHFRGAVFTNLTHDHLDYHKSFKEYLKAKQLLFKALGKEAFALTNLDDKNGMIALQNSKAVKNTYSLRAMADFKARILENSFNGLHLNIDGMDLMCRLSGSFNAYNILAVYGVGRLLNKNKEKLLQAISNCTPPEGRFDFFVAPRNITGIVDYAHTPDAIENVLSNIRKIRQEKGQIITILGCGGNRDQTKRGPMAVIAAKYSDKVFFTSDNPRDEDPEAIIEDMIHGLDLVPELKDKYIAITNRKEAIKVACITAGTGDIILVAGKGHEKYQEIRGEKHPFDDKAILKEYLNR